MVFLLYVGFGMIIAQAAWVCKKNENFFSIPSCSFRQYRVQYGYDKKGVNPFMNRLTKILLCPFVALTVLTGCSHDTTEDTLHAAPLIREEITWIEDDMAALYGVPNEIEVPAGGIGIGTAEELFAIGVEYPLDGDYVLTTDIDLSGISDLTPIGGMASACGIVSGDNVFSGTFDGRGHTIRGLTMELEASVRIHAGLFGSLGSDDPNDPCVVQNLILKDVHITGDFSDIYTLGALAGQASGYVEITNIALLSGSVTATSSGSSLGVGGLVGQLRTNTDTGCSNENITITDIYCGLTVEAPYTDTTGGLIGRIRASNVGELSRILVTGSAKGESGKGQAICGGDGVPLISENVWYLNSAGDNNNGIGQSKSSSSLRELPGKGWSAGEDGYAMPDMVWESPVFSPGLDLMTLRFMAGDTQDHIEYNFTLPSSAGGQSLTWVSDDENYLTIEGQNAVVTKPEEGNVYVHLTCTAGDVSRTYTLRIVSGAEVSLKKDGAWLLADGYPNGTDFCWIVNDSAGEMRSFQWNTTGRFSLNELTADDTVLLRVVGYDELSYQFSAFPTLYIECDTGYYGLVKGTAKEAKMELVTAEGKTEYSGSTQIKLRGNSTAYQEKRPFKLKLAKSTDLFGMGKNKHWVLLANWYDRTNLRNVMSYEMSGRLGMWYCESEWVELYYNGEYYGLYQLCENIRVDDNRVDIFDWDDAAETVAKLCAADHGLDEAAEETLARQLSYDLTWVTKGTDGVYDYSDYIEALGLDITGGYLIENDSYNDEPSQFTTKNGVMYMVTTPNSLVESRDMFRYVKNYFQSVEDAIFSPNRRTEDGKHYMDLMDMDSFADFWFVNEFFKNGEILYKSTFLTLDHGKKLTWGPVWDMDWAGGNHVNLGEGGQSPIGWVHGGGDRQVWSRSMFTDPYCVLTLYERFDDTVTSAMDAALDDLETYVTALQKAADRDNDRWNYPDTFTEEIELYRNWLYGRREWMTAQFATPDTLLSSLYMYQPSETMTITGGVRQGNTLTLTLDLAEGASASGEVFVNGVSCGVVDLGETITVTVPAEASALTTTYDAIELLGLTDDGAYTVLVSRGGIDGCDIWDSAHLYLAK